MGRGGFGIEGDGFQMKSTSKERSDRRRVVCLLVTLFGPLVSVLGGFAAYHFHLLHAIKSRHMEQQVGISLDSIVFTVTVVVIFAVARRVSLPAKL